MALKKIFFGWGLWIFTSDVKSEVVFGSFWLILPGLGPNRRPKYFAEIYVGN